MQIAPIAIVVCVMLLGVGALVRAPVVVAFFSSLAFGSTAIATLTALGGASMMLYVPLSGLLIVSCAARRTVWHDLGRVFRLHWAPMAVLVLLVYVLAGAFVMPRFFAGATTVFVPSRGAIVETALTPVSGNVNQSVYFSLGVITYFAMASRLAREGSLTVLRTGFFAYAAFHTALGVIDLMGKASGAGDLLAPIRTAGYSMLTEVQVEGFWRIVGGYPEASTFAGGSLIVLAFTFSYWRSTGSRMALGLALAILLLLLLCTSTTGYVGLAVLIMFLGLSSLVRLGSGDLGRRDLATALAGIAIVTLLLGILLSSEQLLRPVERLFVETLVNKSTSASAEERFYWNAKSWQAVLDTYGLGVGIGSSRASSSVLAMLSQLGVIGAGLVALILVDMLRPLPPAGPDPADRELAAICRGLRTAAAATVVPAAIAGGGADPGVVFFICAAGVMAGRTILARKASAWHPTPALVPA